jgi:hypothetical protein
MAKTLFLDSSFNSLKITIMPLPKDEKDLATLNRTIADIRNQFDAQKALLNPTNLQKFGQTLSLTAKPNLQQLEQTLDSLITEIAKIKNGPGGTSIGFELENEQGGEFALLNQADNVTAYFLNRYIKRVAPGSKPANSQALDSLAVNVALTYQQLVELNTQIETLQIETLQRQASQKQDAKASHRRDTSRSDMALDSQPLLPTAGDDTPSAQPASTSARRSSHSSTGPAPAATTSSDGLTAIPVPDSAKAVGTQPDVKGLSPKSTAKDMQMFSTTTTADLSPAHGDAKAIENALQSLNAGHFPKNDSDSDSDHSSDSEVEGVNMREESEDGDSPSADSKPDSAKQPLLSDNKRTVPVANIAIPLSVPLQQIRALHQYIYGRKTAQPGLVTPATGSIVIDIPIATAAATATGSERIVPEIKTTSEATQPTVRFQLSLQNPEEQLKRIAAAVQQLYRYEQLTENRTTENKSTGVSTTSYRVLDHANLLEIKLSPVSKYGFVTAECTLPDVVPSGNPSEQTRQRVRVQLFPTERSYGDLRTEQFIENAATTFLAAKKLFTKQSESKSDAETQNKFIAWLNARTAILINAIQNDCIIKPAEMKYDVKAEKPDEKRDIHFKPRYVNAKVLLRAYVQDIAVTIHSLTGKKVTKKQLEAEENELVWKKGRPAFLRIFPLTNPDTSETVEFFDAVVPLSHPVPTSKIRQGGVGLSNFGAQSMGCFDVDQKNGQVTARILAGDGNFYRHSSYPALEEKEPVMRLYYGVWNYIEQLQVEARRANFNAKDAKEITLRHTDVGLLTPLKHDHRQQRNESDRQQVGFVDVIHGILRSLNAEQLTQIFGAQSPIKKLELCYLNRGVNSVGDGVAVLSINKVEDEINNRGFYEFSCHTENRLMELIRKLPTASAATAATVAASDAKSTAAVSPAQQAFNELIAQFKQRHATKPTAENTEATAVVSGPEVQTKLTALYQRLFCLLIKAAVDFGKPLTKKEQDMYATLYRNLKKLSDTAYLAGLPENITYYTNIQSVEANQLYNGEHSKLPSGMAFPPAIVQCVKQIEACEHPLHAAYKNLYKSKATLWVPQLITDTTKDAKDSRPTAAKTSIFEQHLIAVRQQNKELTPQQQLITELLQLYYDTHQAFALRKGKTYKQYAYELQARIFLLTNLIDLATNIFNIGATQDKPWLEALAAYCKSGKDRTGRFFNLVVEYQFFFRLYGYFPRLTNVHDQKLLLQHGLRHAVHLFSVAHDITNANTPGSAGLQIEPDTGAKLLGKSDKLSGGLVKKKYKGKSTALPYQADKPLTLPVLALENDAELGEFSRQMVMDIRSDHRYTDAVLAAPTYIDLQVLLPKQRSHVAATSKDPYRHVESATASDSDSEDEKTVVVKDTLTTCFNQLKQTVKKMHQIRGALTDICIHIREARAPFDEKDALGSITNQINTLWQQLTGQTTNISPSSFPTDAELAVIKDKCKQSILQAIEAPTSTGNKQLIKLWIREHVLRIRQLYQLFLTCKGYRQYFPLHTPDPTPARNPAGYQLLTDEVQKDLPRPEQKETTCQRYTANAMLSLTTAIVVGGGGYGTYRAAHDHLDTDKPNQFTPGVLYPVVRDFLKDLADFTNWGHGLAVVAIFLVIVLLIQNLLLRRTVQRLERNVHAVKDALAEEQRRTSNNLAFPIEITEIAIELQLIMQDLLLHSQPIAFSAPAPTPTIGPKTDSKTDSKTAATTALKKPTHEEMKAAIEQWVEMHQFGQQKTKPRALSASPTATTTASTYRDTKHSSVESGSKRPPASPMAVGNNLGGYGRQPISAPPRPKIRQLSDDDKFQLLQHLKQNFPTADDNELNSAINSYSALSKLDSTAIINDEKYFAPRKPSHRTLNTLTLTEAKQAAKAVGADITELVAGSNATASSIRRSASALGGTSAGALASSLSSALTPSSTSSTVAAGSSASASATVSASASASVPAPAPVPTAATATPISIPTPQL